MSGADHQLTDAIARQLSDASVIMESTPHPEIAEMLRIGANEIERCRERIRGLEDEKKRLCGELEHLDSALLRGRIPTHRCKVCCALWTLWEAQPAKYPSGHPLHGRSWSLFSSGCGKCCDNVAMGDQIQPIQLAAPIARDAT